MMRFGLCFASSTVISAPMPPVPVMASQPIVEEGAYVNVV